MSEYYCHYCAADLGLMNPASPTTLTGTNYQLEKFIKHTMPTGLYPVNSIFNDPNYSSYSNYVLSTTGSGCFVIDDQGRENMIWVAGKEVGVTIRNGILFAPNDSIKVVFHDNEFKIHAYPTISDEVNAKRCIRCGRLIAS